MHVRLFQEGAAGNAAPFKVICFELYQKVIEEIREECYYLIMAGKRLIECRLCNSPGRAVQIGGSRYEFKRTQLFNIEGFYTGGN